MEVSEKFVIIMDKYPKAKLHGLVIARDSSLEGPSDLKAEHLQLLLAMEVYLRPLLKRGASYYCQVVKRPG